MDQISESEASDLMSKLLSERILVLAFLRSPRLEFRLPGFVDSVTSDNGLVVSVSGPLPSVAQAIERLDRSGLPSLNRYRARDGAMLAYRAYPGNSQEVAVIHGSAGQSPGMHTLAGTLQLAGVTAYALDMRGHSASGRRGDIDYIGQLDDDLTDAI